MRSFLDQDTAKIVVHTLIMSKLDYCNSLLIGSAEYQLEKFQRIQNMACRVVLNLKKFDHVPVHIKKSALAGNQGNNPVQNVTLSFKCKNGKDPGSLIDLLPQKKHY